MYLLMAILLPPAKEEQRGEGGVSRALGSLGHGWMRVAIYVIQDKRRLPRLLRRLAMTNVNEEVDMPI